MTLILGLNAFHPDAAACLIKDGAIVAAIAEERLGARIKHAAGFPTQAVRRVMAMAGAGVEDLDFVAVGHDQNANLGAKAARVAAHPLATLSQVLAHFSRRSKEHGIAELIAQACGAAHSRARFRTVHVEHHLAHIASAFYCSPFDEAAAFSYDGSGDSVSAMYARCRGTEIEILGRVFAPHSLGFFYTALSQFIGFDRFGEEYKVMGLSAYGEPLYMDLMRSIARYRGDGQFTLAPRYIDPSANGLKNAADGDIAVPLMYHPALGRELGPPRKRDAPLSQRESDIARSCQQRFEEIVLDCVRWLHERVCTPHLVTAGGCALNGVCNARILRDTPFRNTYIECAASDDGTALGAALHVWHALLKKPRGAAVMNADFGPEYSEAEMEAALRAAGIAFERLDEEALVARAAGLLNAGKVVGWYQGAGEWGPRALGNRSILAHPGWPGMKDLINKKIKRREAFRPFAPSILAERAGAYFEQDIRSPFMMHVVRIREDKRADLSAVTHQDFTGRLHTVTREQNPRFYALIAAFEKFSGVPALLNTSFNENEPIVDTPAQAAACYVRNDLDALCVGPFLAEKELVSSF